MVKPLSRILLLTSLVTALVFSNGSSALAARSGGRIGGGSFRQPPSRSYQPPARYPGGGYGGGYGYGYPGGGVGFPFLLPIFGIGGGFGGLFTILIFIAIANFLVRSFRGASGTYGEQGYDGGYTSSQVSLTRLQVGLLAEARDLQSDLNRIAQTANTGSTEGLDLVLQETTLALLRHPEYWVYANAEAQQSRLEAAEQQFNRLALSERSKFDQETLSNVNQQLRSQPRALPGDNSQSLLEGPSEYIVVTLLVAAQGNLKLPKINASEDLRQALNQLGAVSSDQLLALEVLWSPQAQGDTLTAEDVLMAYPDLKPV